jgi:hypothetical protein
MTEHGHTKYTNIMQYTETVYLDADGVELGRQRNEDDHSYDATAPVPMTDEEVEDWA